MARRVQDALIGTREARRKLKPRGKPYFRTLKSGLHLGYRKLRNGAAGTWVARHYVGDQSYQAEGIGAADDLSDADGVAVLNFWQAQTKARERMVERAHSASGKSGPMTVSAVLDAYLEFLEHNRKSAADTRYRVEALIRPKLGDIKVADLKADQIRKWLIGIAKTAPRMRTGRAQRQNYRELGNDKDFIRRRRASANRNFTVLKAALNRVWREGKVASNAEWRRVEVFQNVSAARIRYLSVAEAQRLINACEPAFRNLVVAALQTGARHGELAALQVHDFNPDAGTVAIRESKSGNPRHVVLTEEGIAFFRQVCAGRAGSATMLLKSDGTVWAKSHQKRPMLLACKNAHISPPTGFHTLRHTWASLAVMAGVPLMVVARNLGHANTNMCERHYSHLAPGYIADAIRAGAPRFGLKLDHKVAVMGQAK